MSLSKKLEKKLKETFYLVDIDKDNYINTNEVGLTLRALGIYLTETEINIINNNIDPNNIGKVSYEDFKKIYIEKLQTNKTIDDLINAFQFFDKNGTNKINFNQLKHNLKFMGDSLTEEEINTLKEEFNIDEEGNLNYINLSKKIFEEQ
jgi:Ca2+-binding EF-hand superfamily protein